MWRQQILKFCPHIKAKICVYSFELAIHLCTLSRKTAGQANFIPSVGVKLLEIESVKTKNNCTLKQVLHDIQRGPIPSFINLVGEMWRVFKGDYCYVMPHPPTDPDRNLIKCKKSGFNSSDSYCNMVYPLSIFQQGKCFLKLRISLNDLKERLSGVFTEQTLWAFLGYVQRYYSTRARVIIV